MPTAAKVAEVEALVQEFKEAKSVVLADFVGMDVATMTELRRRLHAERVSLRVAKNTFSRRALESLGVTEMTPMLEGPTAIAVARNDELAAIRVLTAFAKEKEKPRVKGGMVGGKVYTLAEIKTLAGLPPRNELLGQLLATFEAPVTQVIGMMSRMTSDLISIMDQLVEKKGGAAGSTGAAAAPSEPAASEAAPAEDAGGAEAAGASD
jgi:large subunit ribosomal protein L10